MNSVNNKSKLSEDGRITVPEGIRQHHDIEPGDWLSFEIQNNQVIVRKDVSKILKYYGSVEPRHDIPKDPRELRKQVEQAIADDIVRRMEQQAIEDEPR